jgi:sensor histidine kinase YesM
MESIDIATEKTFFEEFITATKVLVGLTLVCILAQYLFQSSTTWEDIKSWIIINSLFNYPFYFANEYLSKYLNKVLPWNADLRRRAILGTLITFVVNLVVIYCVVTVVSVIVFNAPWDYVFTSQGRGTILTTLVIVTLLILLFHSIEFLKASQKNRLISEQLRKEKVSAELDALKAQVNPHFLFNSFNVLSGLIDEEPRQAQRFLKGLSNIYRHILEHRDEDFVSLEEELDFAREFIKLQQVRFEEGIILNIMVPDEKLQQRVPALSLQLLMENATKHNGFNKAQPLTIRVQAQNGHLEVSNNKQARRQLIESNGMGLENIRMRYQLVGREGFEVEETPDQFTVKLPLL